MNWQNQLIWGTGMLGYQAIGRKFEVVIGNLRRTWQLAEALTALGRPAHITISIGDRSDRARELLLDPESSVHQILDRYVAPDERPNRAGLEESTLVHLDGNLLGDAHKNVLAHDFLTNRSYSLTTDERWSDAEIHRWLPSATSQVCEFDDPMAVENVRTEEFFPDYTRKSDRFYLRALSDKIHQSIKDHKFPDFWTFVRFLQKDMGLNPWVLRSSKGKYLGIELDGPRRYQRVVLRSQAMRGPEAYERVLEHLQISRPDGQPRKIQHRCLADLEPHFQFRKEQALRQRNLPPVSQLLFPLLKDDWEQVLSSVSQGLPASTFNQNQNNNLGTSLVATAAKLKANGRLQRYSQSQLQHLLSQRQGEGDRILRAAEDRCWTLVRLDAARRELVPLQRKSEALGSRSGLFAPIAGRRLPPSLHDRIGHRSLHRSQVRGIDPEEAAELRAHATRQSSEPPTSNPEVAIPTEPTNEIEIDI
jgi:hypothetical protein